MVISIKTKIIGSAILLFFSIIFLVQMAQYRRNLLVHGMLDLETAVKHLSALVDLQVAMDRVIMPVNDYLINGR